MEIRILCRRGRGGGGAGERRVAGRLVPHPSPKTSVPYRLRSDGYVFDFALNLPQYIS